MLREKIKFNGQNQSIKIPLGGKNDVVGQDQSIDGFIAEETGLSINKPTDGEKTRYLPERRIQHIFNFWDGNVTFDDTLTNAGFTQDDVDTQSEAIRKSFYIVQVFDNLDIENQTLLHSGYFNGFVWVTDTGLESRYPLLGGDTEFTNWYIPNSFRDRFSDQNTLTVYVRFLFYNAKRTNNPIQVFLNTSNLSDRNEERFFFQVTLDFENRSYDYPSLTNIQNTESDNSEYITKINNTIDTFDNQRIIYPDGNFFGLDGLYTDVDD